MAGTTESIHLPRIAITFCTQCRWMLRAAYFAQELLSTFSTAIGEVALIPATGGVFQVHLTYTPVMTGNTAPTSTVQTVLLWDRKTEGGFPETKVLKQILRNHIEPGRDLGHSDKPSNKHSKTDEAAKNVQPAAPVTQNESNAKECEDCQ
ncbi:hypothetical protein CAC42_2665 [Sphaceloma murrayae]|uniref:Selenoprotein W-like protein n=1 Tax=Sphaceloma murrayae TaxID=2082308 RepID=A0A2K1QKC0_9PEZI|nr:hypothetical protein CAC42_2665 [Sphaceloma murrayae]